MMTSAIATFTTGGDTAVRTTSPMGRPTSVGG